MPHTHLDLHVKAPREVVFRALTTATSVQQWMVPEGMSSRVHDFEAREGGFFRISLTYDDGAGQGKSSAHTDTYHGHFVTFVQDDEVVQTMQFETEDPTMQGKMWVSFRLVDHAGGTWIHAVHANVPAGVSPEDNMTGWRSSLAKLRALVETV